MYIVFVYVYLYMETVDRELLNFMKIVFDNICNMYTTCKTESNLCLGVTKTRTGNDEWKTKSRIQRKDCI